MAITQVESAADDPRDSSDEAISIELAPGDQTLLAGSDVTGANAAAAQRDGEPDSTPPTRRFTVVGDAATAHRTPQRAIVPVLAAAIALAALVYGGSRLLTPPDADALYDAIQAVDAESWARGDDGAREKIEAFEQRFADDPRIASLQPLRDQLAVADLSRRLRASLLRGDLDSNRLSAGERLYLAAMQAEKTDPLDAARQLRLLADLLSVSPPAESGGGKPQEVSIEPSVGESPNQLVLRTLVRQQIERIEQAIASDAAKHLPFVSRRLVAAREMRVV